MLSSEFRGAAAEPPESPDTYWIVAVLQMIRVHSDEPAEPPLGFRGCLSGYLAEVEIGSERFLSIGFLRRVIMQARIEW